MGYRLPIVGWSLVLDFQTSHWLSKRKREREPAEQVSRCGGRLTGSLVLEGHLALISFSNIFNK